MVKLRYIGTHQPKDMIVDVDNKKVESLIESGDYTLDNIKADIKKRIKD